MEQQSGASGAAQAQAARTILPGEPFDPPAASQVPAPRDEAAAPAPAEAPAYAPVEAPAVPQAWTYQPPAPESAPLYQPMGAPEGAPLYQSMPAPQAEPQPYGGQVDSMDSLHEFASLPEAPQYAPAPTTQAFAPAAFPAPTETQPVFSPMQPEAFAPPQSEAAFPPPVFAPAEDSLPPLPPPQDNEGLLAEPDKKKERKSVDKRLLAGALVLVLAGGGYFGYTQLTKKSSSSTANTPVVPVTTPVVHYNFPSNIAGLKLQSAASSASLRGVVLGQVKAFNPQLAKSLSFASYSAGQPSIIVMSFHPGAAKLAADYAALVKYSATPDAGNVAVASHTAVPGAAGGQMTCGGESGSHPYSWCAWRGTGTVGVMQISGSPKSQITEILTREMRAYAEH